jgi:ribosome-associated protein
MKLPIRLDQFIKRMDIAQTGGHAKILIQNGEISVNSEVELRRGRKLIQGDVVTYGGQSWKVSA